MKTLVPLRGLAGIAAAISLAACNAMDPYAERFEHIQIGDAKTAVEATMGTAPSSSNSLELPLLPRIETLAWKSMPNGKLYLTYLAMGRVVAKSTVQ